MYVFDTSALIGAWTETQPRDVFPSFWTSFEQLIEEGHAIAPFEVFAELKKDDDLLAWATERKDVFFVPTTEALMLGAADALRDHRNLVKHGPGRNPADPFVIAFARQRSWRVVTHEMGGTGTRPRIPYVCGELGVPWGNVVNVARAQGWTF